AAATGAAAVDGLPPVRLCSRVGAAEPGKSELLLDLQPSNPRRCLSRSRPDGRGAETYLRRVLPSTPEVLPLRPSHPGELPAASGRPFSLRPGREGGRPRLGPVKAGVPGSQIGDRPVTLTPSAVF